MATRSSSRQSKSQPTTSSPSAASQLNPSSNGKPIATAIVGIGASAGGLEAFTLLLRHLSIETGMAYVLIQHLDPQHKSLLTEILARTTQMPVTEITDGIEIEPNHIYIIPPNTQTVFRNGRLKLSPREKTKGIFHPIDLFFHSIAAECGSQAIGVVLSGGDGDGALGLSAIKAAGGITFAQDLPSSQFGGMPHSAANTGQVDFILPPAEIAKKLNQMSAHSGSAAGGTIVATASQPDPTAEIDLDRLSERPLTPKLSPNTALADSAPAQLDPLDRIFELLQLQTGANFAGYKHATLNRRMQRRMHQQQIGTVADYLNYLVAYPAEVEALYRDFLIDVTSFFRDPVAFQSLKDNILPQIVRQQQVPKAPIRVWVAGCATGEEVYSIAICLLEVLAELKLPAQIQIFATDLNELAIETARAGIYSKAKVEGVSAERLQQFFIPVAGGYQIDRAVRDLCVFAKHNLCSDPPFSRLDTIVCRNVLIYFGAKLQKKVMQTLHYGLKPTGFLMLGSSETTGSSADLFHAVEFAEDTSAAKQYKFYTKKLVSLLPNLDFTIGGEIRSYSPLQPPIAPDDRTANIDLQQITDDIVWKRYAPAGVTIDSDLQILQFRGDTSPYLSSAPGKPSFSLLKMARVDLRVELRAAIYQAKKLNLPVSKSSLSELIKFEVIPVRVPGLAERYFLILFEPLVEALPTSLTADLDQANEAAGLPEMTLTRKRARKTLVERENLQLKHKLALTQEHLQTITEEQEAIEQAARATQEEMLSSNEEFQSTNEELETAKEEIQAANEELSTVNEELRNRNLEATQANNDLLNILSSVRLPILIVDTDLRIGRFTPMAERIFNLIPTDLGRSFKDIRHNLNIPDLDRSILQTIETLTIYQQEIQDRSGNWYQLEIRPYQTHDKIVAGATVVLIDINELKQRAQEIQVARDYANAIVETVWEPQLVLDRELRIVTVNHAFYEMFEFTPPQVAGQLLDKLENGQWQILGLRSWLEDLFSHATQVEDFEVEHTFERIGQRTLQLNARQIPAIGNDRLILLAIVDITQRKHMDTERAQLFTLERTARSTADAANLAKDVFLSILSHELRSPLSAMLGWSRLLRSGKLTPAQVEHGLEVIDRSASIQNQLIEDLLDISSITNGKLRLDAELIDLVPVIEAAIDTVAISATAKNIQIHTQLDPFPDRILGDFGRLQQVMWNILGNAIKFTDPGGKVTVRLSSVDRQPTDTTRQSAGYAQIQVIDNGKGIDPEFLPHVFDRFLQADSSAQRNYAGLGLGLTIVRHIVELHGGTIEVVSAVGSGSTFTIRLPLSPRIAGESAPPAADAIDLGATTLVDASTLIGIHVLLVDDEEDVRTLIATILEQSGATVTPVAAAPAALQLLQAAPQKYAVLLSDIGMPGQDGWSFIRQVRALSAAAGGQIPAAALTAYASSRERALALQLGFQIHIAKPVEPDLLVAIVADLARD